LDWNEDEEECMARLVKREEVAEILRELISGNRTQEDAARWALDLDREDVEVEDDRMWTILNAISMAAETRLTEEGDTDDPYIFGQENFQQWLAELLGLH
jgi:hypothetical protein